MEYLAHNFFSHVLLTKWHSNHEQTSWALQEKQSSGDS